MIVVLYMDALVYYKDCLIEYKVAIFVFLRANHSLDICITFVNDIPPGNVSVYDS